ncbi:hypothetical protein QWM81_27210 [Streptomyces ficellus]|uniref:DUF4034 domain-containing protein n=1 Tax=Streptomyces ficellus TaxID=1977088 RepID=A0ABT7ZE19_9ACTN|nr:hypothetical protein [Streptomyces ficellus]MDN3297661.1 hypothetical protein [Streptomyces ficellus]
MTTLLWIILTPIALALLAIGLYFLKAIVQGAIEGLRSSGDEPADYRIPEEVAAQGFLPRERQDTDAGDPLPAEAAAAEAAALAGDWRAAAALLERQRLTGDWDRRYQFVNSLAGEAVEEDAWLLAWEAAAPEDPDAAVVRATSTIGLAWALRGGALAQDTTSEQFRGFHRTIAVAREQVARAARLAPADPCPYIEEIWVALALGYPHSEMDRLWTEITARAPHHYMAHYAALQYWCAKWRGSEELATEFAERAAASAPPGTLLTALPLFAHFEHDNGPWACPEGADTPRMRAAVDAALADAAAADPTHPYLIAVRNVLAYYLAHQERYEAAVEQFRLVDGRIGVVPWSYHGDPAEVYLELRDKAVLQAARAAGRR